MKMRPAHGVLVISIDVAADPAGLHAHDGSAAADAAAVIDATKWLLRMLDQCRLPATWFLAGPGSSVLRSHVMAAEMRHEIGLLVSESGPSQRGRFEFSRNLKRRLLSARAAGVEISSLATRESKRIEHLDLLVKHGIRAVRQAVSRPDRNSSERFGWAAVSTLRFGISSLPTTLCAAEPQRWPRWVRGWDDRRQLTAAAVRHQYCHLTLDIHSIAEARARKRTQATLRLAAKQFHNPDCRIETISSLASSLMARPVTPSAQSILRAA